MAGVRTSFALFLAAIAALIVFGALTEGVFRPDIRTAAGTHRFLVFLACFVGWSTFWVAVRPAWLMPLTVALAGAWMALTGGAGAVLTVIGLALACRAVGRRIDPNPAISIAMGCAVLILAIQGLAWLPVNTPAVYITLIAAPIALDHPELRGDMAVIARRAASVDRWTAIGALPLLLALLCQWLAAWKPEVGADALAMHLTIPAWIAGHGSWSFDIDRFVYATMPLGANWLFTAAYLPGGEMAARLANFGALGLTAALIRNCTRSNLAAALYVSTPVLELVTGSLFVENTQAAFALAAAMAGGPVRGALLLGAAMMIKLSSLTFVAPLVLLLAWQHRRASWRRWGIAAGVFLLWALPAYVTAFARTGNPVFPLANAWFRSGGFGTNAMFTDPRFAQPLSWTTLYDLTFHSSRYFEGWDGAFGMQWLLAPLVILIPGAGRRTVAAGCVSAAAVLMTAPNLRYLTPALAMIAPAFGAIGARGWIAQAALLGCFAANLWLMPASSSWHRDSALNWLDSQAVTAYVLEHAPARALVAEMNREGAGKPVLFVENTHFAGLSGRAYSNSWYHYSFASRLEHADSTEAINELLRGSGIEYAVAPAPEAVPQWGLAELLDRQGRVVSRSGALRLYAIEREPRAAREVIVLGPGRYENDSAGLRFSGSWRRQGGFADASSGSVTYSEVTGATARIRFRGTGLRWIFTRAPNRGLARVRVDGGAAREVDLHAADVAWQASYSVTELPAGEHEAVIEVGGRGFVDVDAVEVAGESAP